MFPRQSSSLAVHGLLQTTVLCRRSTVFNPFSRHCTLARLSYHASPSTTVSIPWRGRGHSHARGVSLDIYHPSVALANSTNDPGAAVIYLPSGLEDVDSTASSVIEAIRSAVPHPIVRLNYSSGPNLSYPDAIHQVLAGYDWVLRHLLPSKGPSRHGRASRSGRVVVVGEHVGGALATMLALTECRLGEPGVVAAAVNEPLLDWVSLGSAEDEDRVSKEPQDLDSPLSPPALLRLRRSAFLKPVTYFDPFASPMLFLRSASASVPSPRRPPPDDLEQLSMFEREDFFRQQKMLSTTPIDINPAPVEELQEVKRKASFNFPSKALGIRLPCFNISSREESSFSSQAKEFTQLLRKSVIRQKTQASSSFGRKVLMAGEEREMDEDERLEAEARVSEAERQIQFLPRSVDQPWNIVQVASWLRQML